MWFSGLEESSQWQASSKCQKIEGEISKFMVEAYGEKQQHRETYVITMGRSNETKCF
jgi:hypothetical protein